MKKKWLLIPAILAAMVISGASLFASFVAPKVEEVAAAYPAGSDVYFVTSGGTKCNFSTVTYYKNNGVEGDSDNFNIAYFYSTGIMFLNGYDGQTIYSNSSNKLIVMPYSSYSNYIDAADGLVKTDCAYGIYSKGPVEINGGGTGPISIRLKDNLTGGKQFYGIYSDDDIKIGNATVGGVGITVTATKTANRKYGIYSKEGSVDIAGRANISMTMNNDCDAYGIYVNEEGESLNVNISSSKAVDIRITDSEEEMPQDSVAYGIRADGNILITGEGDLYLKYDGTCSSNGIYMDGSYYEYYSLTFDKLNSATIIGFEDGLDVFCNNSDDVTPSDNYDIIISEVDSFLIESDFEDGYGVSVFSAHTYGIKIVDSSLTYDGLGYPARSLGLNGLDIYGGSKVIFKGGADKYMQTANSTCNVELDGGYFELGYHDGSMADNNLLYRPFFDLGVNNYIVDWRWSENISNSDGAYTYHLPSNVDAASFVIRGISTDMEQDIRLGGAKLTKAKPCFVNGSSTPSAITPNYNAMFDFDKNILYLVGYEGGKIYYDCTYDDVLRIVVQDDSTIESDDYGIQFAGNGSLEIISDGESLDINVESEDDTVYGIYLQTGSMTLYKDIELNIEVKDNADNGAVGICLDEGNLDILDYTDLNVKVSSGNSTTNEYDAALYAKYIFIDTYSEGNRSSAITLDTTGVKNGSSTIRCTNLTIGCIDRMEIFWNSEKTAGKPCYPTNALDLISEITVNKDEDAGYLNVVMGRPLQLYVTNGVLFYNSTYLSEGMVPENSTVYLLVESIEDIDFVAWSSTDLSAIANPEAGLTTVSVGSTSLTIEATYENISIGSNPRFDSRGEEDSGYVAFDLKGDPKQVRLVPADYDEKSKAIDTNKFNPEYIVQEADVAEGEYKIAAQYTSVFGHEVWLFTESFEIEYGQPALDYEMSFSSGGTNPQYHIDETKAGEFTIPGFMHDEPESKKFDSWYAIELKKTYKPGDKVKVHNDITFIPQFTDRTAYTVSYDANGGTGDMDDSTVYEGRDYELPECGFTAPNGYEFDHWDIDDMSYDVGDEYEVTGNVTAVAIWKESESGGTSTSAPTSQPTSQPTSDPTSEPSGDTSVPTEPTSAPTSEPTSPTSTPSGSDSPTSGTSSPVDPTPEEDGGGLSGGAIAGIIVGSVLVLGIGGFSLYWFVLAGKSMKDLGSLFSKGINGIKNIFKKK